MSAGEGQASPSSGWTLSPSILVRVACASYETLDPFANGNLSTALDRLDEAEAAWERVRTKLEDRLFELAGPPGVGAPPVRFVLLALRREVHAGRAEPRELATHM